MKKFALITGGGGMNCAYFAGWLSALVSIYKIENLELVIGASGGVGSLACLVAKQHQSLEKIWTDRLASEKVISFKRVKRILDVDYIIDCILGKKEPLDYRKIASSKTKFLVAVTDAKTGKGKFFSNRQKFSMAEVMRASKAVPLVYGKKIKISGREYVDGSIGISLNESIRRARKEGVRNIVVVQSDSTGSRTSRYFWRVCSWFVSRPLRIAINNSLSKKLDLHKFADCNILAITPSSNIRIHSLDNSRKSLRRVFDLGFKDASNDLGLKSFLKLPG